MHNRYLTWAKWLLLVGGVLHGIPGLYAFLSGITGRFPLAQVLLGWTSVIIALMALKFHH